jgi:hypothetical protein
MSVIPGGKLKLVSPENPNTPNGSAVIFVLITTLVKAVLESAVQESNAPSPIFVTLLGMTTLEGSPVPYG